MNYLWIAREKPCIFLWQLCCLPGWDFVSATGTAAWLLRPLAESFVTERPRWVYVARCFYKSSKIRMQWISLVSQNQFRKEDLCRLQKKTKAVRMLSRQPTEFRALGSLWCWGRGSWWGPCHQPVREQFCPKWELRACLEASDVGCVLCLGVRFKFVSIYRFKKRQKMKTRKS